MDFYTKNVYNCKNTTFNSGWKNVIFFIGQDYVLSIIPVSYTHLDVYKRQIWFLSNDNDRQTQSLSK